MTKGLYTCNALGFGPKDDAARKYWGRFKPGDDVLLTFTLPRSLIQLKLYWALIDIAYLNNRDNFESQKETSDSIKLACGLSDTIHIKYNGEWFIRKAPASIAFESMAQDEFNEFFEKALAYICAELVPGLTVETLRTEVQAAAA